MNKKFNIGIVGATSLLAGNIIKILGEHPFIDLKVIVSEHNPGEPLHKFHNIRNNELKKQKLDSYSPDRIKKELDLVFVAKPHTQSMKYVKELYNGKLKIIDLSGDFRIQDVSAYEKWYKTKHTAKDLIEGAVYGLSEIYKDDLKKALLVANPGCFPTGVLLPLYPLIKKKMILLDSISITAYTGVSGAGKNPIPGKNLFLDIFNNIMAYRITDHQHTPEIEEQLSLFSGDKTKINFVPHLVSIEDGIYSTMYMKLQAGFKSKDICSALQDFYKASPFITLTETIPQIKDVTHTNSCLIYPEVNERTGSLILISVIDNTIKGGAGQAIQNMNLMLGFDDATGLI
ncbi:MAG: N-acetyl-gamma-glutamyl-phosphate reductase [Spirochaetes bacterium]|nr:N-acetyl-gamma-glutamyl-phosphate reductase [Spirochaetota bacterium]